MQGKGGGVGGKIVTWPSASPDLEHRDTSLEFAAVVVWTLQRHLLPLFAAGEMRGHRSDLCYLSSLQGLGRGGRGEREGGGLEEEGEKEGEEGD